MKKIMFLAYLFSMPFAASAINAGDSDTVVIIGRPSVVKIIEKDNRKTIEIEGVSGEEKYRYTYVSEVSDTTDTSIVDGLFAFNAPLTRMSRKKSGNRRTVDCFRDIYSGVVIPAGAAYGFEKVGWEIGMLNLLSAVWSFPAARSEISVGFGWWYRRMPVSGGMMIDGDNRGNISLIPVEPVSNVVKSHVRSFGLSIPVTYFCRLSGKFGIEFGGIAQFNTYTRAATSRWENGIEHKYIFKGLHQRILTVDALLRIGFRNDVSLYARYSPMSMFEPEHGPSTSHVSIGLTLGF